MIMMYMLKLEYSPNLNVIAWLRNVSVYFVRYGHAFGGFENGLLRVLRSPSVTISSSPCSRQNFAMREKMSLVNEPD